MKFLLSIRGKLLLVSLILLAIPLLGYQFIRDMETFLREGQERALESSTRAIAASLSERPYLLTRGETNPDDPTALERRQVLALFGSSDPETVASLGAAYQPSEEIERTLELVGRSASRIWVVDTQSRVRGLYGSLKNSGRQPAEASSGAATQVTRALARLFDLPSPDAKDDPKSSAKAVMAHVDRALIGSPSSFWRVTQDKRGIVLSAAQPIWSGDNIVGAVVVEETTGAIQLLKLNALENLLTITTIVFVAGFLTLVLFAWRLAARVRKLGRQAESAIDAQGRIRGDIEPSTIQDELGELSRNLAATVRRLKDYNTHLENMAGRLSHELRTPVAVVRSSLDNLKLHGGEADAGVYIERADEGVTRLSTLISRLSEATQLEHFLQDAERERFDLAQVVAGCVAGYRQAYPRYEFTVSCEPAELRFHGVPDAIAQLLDKLVSNAIDFHTAGTAIEVSLQRHGGFVKLGVSNQGPLLSPDIGATLFSSMVSLRPDNHADKPGAVGHLGLGLYIVRLIAEFHGGHATAENRRDSAGVTVAVHLPL